MIDDLLLRLLATAMLVAIVSALDLLADLWRERHVGPEDYLP